MAEGWSTMLEGEIGEMVDSVLMMVCAILSTGKQSNTLTTPHIRSHNHNPTSRRRSSRGGAPSCTSSTSWRRPRRYVLRVGD